MKFNHMSLQDYKTNTCHWQAGNFINRITYIFGAWPREFWMFFCQCWNRWRSIKTWAIADHQCHKRVNNNNNSKRIQSTTHSFKWHPNFILYLLLKDKMCPVIERIERQYKSNFIIHITATKKIPFQLQMHVFFSVDFFMLMLFNVPPSITSL